MAGDIFSAFSLSPRRQDAESRSARKRAEKFCQNELSQYQRVLYVMGNHESYRETIEATPGILREFLAKHAPNTQLLDNEMVEIDGVAFLGTTLWARCGVGVGANEWLIGNGMRDFERINTTAIADFSEQMRISRDGTRRFRPADANRLHQLNKLWLAETAPRDRPVVVITHHAPSFQSGRANEFGEAYMDDAYCGNLVDFFLERPNIKLAVHGHTHRNEHYRIGETLVIANQRGYFPMEPSSRKFDPSAEDVDTKDWRDT